MYCLILLSWRWIWYEDNVPWYNNSDDTPAGSVWANLCWCRQVTPVMSGRICLQLTTCLSSLLPATGPTSGWLEAGDWGDRIHWTGHTTLDWRMTQEVLFMRENIYSRHQSSGEHRQGQGRVVQFWGETQNDILCSCPCPWLSVCVMVMTSDQRGSVCQGCNNCYRWLCQVLVMLNLISTLLICLFLNPNTELWWVPSDSLQHWNVNFYFCVSTILQFYNSTWNKRD